MFPAHHSVLFSVFNDRLLWEMEKVVFFFLMIALYVSQQAASRPVSLFSSHKDANTVAFVLLYQLRKLSFVNNKVSINLWSSGLSSRCPFPRGVGPAGLGRSGPPGPAALTKHGAHGAAPAHGTKAAALSKDGGASRSLPGWLRGARDTPGTGAAAPPHPAAGLS